MQIQEIMNHLKSPYDESLSEFLPSWYVELRKEMSKDESHVREVIA